MPHLVIKTSALSKGCRIRKAGFDLPAELYAENVVYCSKHSPTPCSCDDPQSRVSAIALVNALERFGWRIISAYSYSPDNLKQAWILHKEREPRHY